jgi:hypothetical protein
MDKTLAARRLSAALGVEIQPSQIERVSEEGFVKLTDGGVFCLAGGNAAFKGGVMGDTVEDYQPGVWFKNGKPWNIGDESVRPLPGQKKHVLDFPPRHPPTTGNEKAPRSRMTTSPA